MEQVIRTVPQLMHPLVSAAAISVIALSATGIAAFTGVLPMHKTAAPEMIVPAALASPAAAPAAAPVIAPEPEPVKPKPVRTKVVRVSAPVPVAQAGEPAYNPTAVSSNGSGYSGAEYPAYPANPAPVVAQAPVPAAAPIYCAACGTIENVREVKQAGEAKGLGAVAGGVGGAVLGKQFGNGRGSTALAVLGAVGGAFAGHQIEKQVRSTTAYEVTVRMEDGSSRTIQQATTPAWRIGERVRVNGEAISVI